MAINFDQLPESNGGSTNKIIPKGTYYASIEKTEMKKPQDTTKPEYLNITLKVQSAQGENMGFVWDKITESTSQYVLYKLRRFIMALGVTITPGLSLELKDLAKIAPGVKLLVDINQDKENKNQVDIFSGDVYYHISEANKIFGTDSLFVDASDAEDNPFIEGTPTNENVEY